jgi:hypothetical protein
MSIGIFNVVIPSVVIPTHYKPQYGSGEVEGIRDSEEQNSRAKIEAQMFQFEASFPRFSLNFFDRFHAPFHLSSISMTASPITNPFRSSLVPSEFA